MEVDQTTMMQVRLVMQAVLDKQGTEKRVEMVTLHGRFIRALAAVVLTFVVSTVWALCGMVVVDCKMIGRQVHT